MLPAQEVQEVYKSEVRIRFRKTLSYVFLKTSLVLFLCCLSVGTTNLWDPYSGLTIAGSVALDSSLKKTCASTSTLTRATTRSSLSADSAVIAVSAGPRSRFVVGQSHHSLSSTSAHMYDFSLSGGNCFNRNICSIMREPSPSSVRSAITQVCTEKMSSVTLQSTTKRSQSITQYTDVCSTTIPHTFHVCVWFSYLFYRKKKTETVNKMIYIFTYLNTLVLTCDNNVVTTSSLYRRQRC